MELDFKHSLLSDRDRNILIPLSSSSLPPLPPSELQDHIQSLRGRLNSISFHDPLPSKQSTFATSLIVCNNTLGSAVMILPIVFGTCGIITSLIVLLVIGFVQYITCNLCVIHMKENEPDLPEIIERILGKTAKILFVISSCFFEFLAGIIYLALMNNMLYPIIVFILAYFGFENCAKKSEFRFDVFSFQINSLIFMIPCFLSCFLSNINMIATLSKIGIYVLISYIIFLFYILYDNFTTGVLQENLGNIVYFTTNITDVSGAFCMAFFIHNVICPLLKNIAKKEDSTKAIAHSYIMSCSFYFIIAIIGYLGILGREVVEENPQTIMDLFERKSLFPLVIEVFYFMKLVTVYPLFCFVSRSQFLSVLPKKVKNVDNEENSQFWVKFMYNTAYIGIAMICVVYNVNITFIMGFTGAVFGFILVYAFPIAIHLKCYGFERKMPDGKKWNVEERCEIIEKMKCNEHKDMVSNSGIKRNLFYLCGIVPVGVYLMAIQIIALFDLKWLKNE